MGQRKVSSSILFSWNLLLFRQPPEFSEELLEHQCSVRWCSSQVPSLLLAQKKCFPEREVNNNWLHEKCRKLNSKNGPRCCYIPLLPRDNPREQLQRALLGYLIQKLLKGISYFLVLRGNKRVKFLSTRTWTFWWRQYTGQPLWNSGLMCL